MTKACTKCGKEKPLTEFPEYRGKGKVRRVARCRPCHLAVRREREREQNSAAKRERYKDPEHRRTVLSQNHKWRYGITLDEKDAILAAQGGVCAICGTNEPGERGWYTDHDHACCPEIRSCGNCIRGVLCKRCNFALGQFDDDMDKLRSAIDYLRAWAVDRIPA